MPEMTPERVARYKDHAIRRYDMPDHHAIIVELATALEAAWVKTVWPRTKAQTTLRMMPEPWTAKEWWDFVEVDCSHGRSFYEDGGPCEACLLAGFRAYARQVGKAFRQKVEADVRSRIHSRALTLSGKTQLLADDIGEAIRALPVETP